MLCALSARRVSGVVHARVCAARVSGVRGALRCVRMAIVTTRTFALLHRSAPPSKFLLVCFLSLCTRFCRFCSAFASASPPLLLLLLSALHSVSAFCSALRLCVLLCSALVSASFPSVTHRVRLQQNYYKI